MKNKLLFGAMCALTTALSMPINAQDQRIVIELTPEERAYVLGHMRTMLETITEVHQDLADNDLDSAADRIKTQQQQRRKGRPDSLSQSLPASFRAMSKQMNQQWQPLTQPVSSPQELHQKLVPVMNTCNACHQSFQIRSNQQ